MWNWEGEEGLSAPGDDSGLRGQGRQSASDFCKVRDYQDLVPLFGFFPPSGELFQYFFSSSYALSLLCVVCRDSRGMKCD